MSNTVIEWRLRSLARSKGMGPTELSVRLRSLGGGRSGPQMSRLLNYPPEMVSLRLVGGLCDVLDCGLQELLRPGWANDPEVGADQ